MQTSRLRDRTVELLKSRPRTVRYKDISADTGLSPRWLEDFSQGKVAEPSVIKVEALYVYLTGAELSL